MLTHKNTQTTIEILSSMLLFGGIAGWVMTHEIGGV